MPKKKTWGVFDDTAQEDAVLRMDLNHKLRYLRTVRNRSIASLGEQLEELMPAGLSSSRGLIDRLESGAITEDAASPVLLAALAHLLDVPSEFMAPSRHDDMLALSELLGRR